MYLTALPGGGGGGKWRRRRKVGDEGMMQIQIIIRKSCSKDPLLQNMFCHFRICSFTIERVLLLQIERVLILQLTN